MRESERERLREIKTFPSLVKYLREELDWPVGPADFEELTFDYEPEELGLDAKTAVKIDSIRQLRPLTSNQPWGIFFVKFAPKRLPVVALRRILRSLVIKKRQSARRSEQPSWHLNDLLYISAYGEGDKRQITFAHFGESPETSDLPTLRVLGWDDADTALHIDHVHQELHEKLHWPDDETNVETWRETWSSAFTLRHREVITTSKQLAVRLAELATTIRTRANTVLSVESESGPMRKMYKAFQEVLIHDLSEDDFADMYAQTITYGLLSARVSRPAGLVAENVADMVPITNPFLRDLLSTFLTVGGRKGKIDFDEVGINDVVETLREANMEAVLRDFGDRTPEEDPVIHFYELFLKEYDPRKRIQRGVFYTPRPVVSFIVRSVDEILRNEFGLDDGLADTATWGEMAKRHLNLEIPKGAKSKDHFVRILDPACGTGTFLVEVIDIVHKTMIARWRKEGRIELELPKLWNEYVADHLLPRLYGFEIMMAPYAVAHMKLGLKLHETGYDFHSHERARIYLTNSLEEPEDFSDRFEFDAPALAHEAKAVNIIKGSLPATVIVGNPPYSNYGMLNQNDWILGLLEDYKKGLHEKKLNINDDFIKFFRFAQWSIERTNCGVWSFISNNTYIDGITHRRMRESLMETFSKIYVLDLHGSSKKRETCPDGSKDENVFDIQQGVAVGIFSRSSMQRHETEVWHTELWGPRQVKYRELRASDLSKKSWRRLNPEKEHFFFVPKDFGLREEYSSYPGLQEIFAISQNGIQTDRDKLFFDFNRQRLEDRIRRLFSKDGMDPAFREEFRVEDSSSYDLLSRRKRTSFDSKSIHRCLYRPFDYHWLYYSVGITSRPAWDVMRHLLPGNNLALLGMRQYDYNVPDYCYVYVANKITERRIFISNRGAAILFPLYRYPESRKALGLLKSERGRQPNLHPKFTENLQTRIGLSFQPIGKGDLKNTYGPEDLFNYIYSVLHSPTYRTRYSEFLKIDFPHLPLTSSVDLFCALAALGGELVSLHLMESPKLDRTITKWKGATPSGGVEKVSYADETVWIDKAQTQGFSGVPEAVWNFHIGGYQVCEKWLKDRRPKKGKPGRKLSKKDTEHYQKIVVALKETIRLMAEIDKVIDKHGGWPDAFVTD